MGVGTRSPTLPPPPLPPRHMPTSPHAVEQTSAGLLWGRRGFKSVSRAFVISQSRDPCAVAHQQLIAAEARLTQRPTNRCPVLDVTQHRLTGQIAGGSWVPLLTTDDAYQRPQFWTCMSGICGCRSLPPLLTLLPLSLLGRFGEGWPPPTVRLRVTAVGVRAGDVAKRTRPENGKADEEAADPDGTPLGHHSSQTPSEVAMGHGQGPSPVLWHAAAGCSRGGMPVA